MPRELGERSERETQLRPPERTHDVAAPSAPATPTLEWIVRPGANGITVRREPLGVTLLAHERALVRAVAIDAVTAFTRQASLLVDAPLPVKAGDEVELRTPPLVSPDGCVALVRRASAIEPAFWIAGAPSPEALSSDILPVVVPLARDEVKRLVAALHGAVSATPRNA